MRPAPARDRLRYRQSARPPAFFGDRIDNTCRYTHRGACCRNRIGSAAAAGAGQEVRVTDFFATILARAEAGETLAAADALALAGDEDLPVLMRVAASLRDAGHGGLISYSRKVFIPLTQLCRDVCHYCTFAHPPRRDERVYLNRDEVLEIARAGAK